MAARRNWPQDGREWCQFAHEPRGKGKSKGKQKYTYDSTEWGFNAGGYSGSQFAHEPRGKGKSKGKQKHSCDSVEWGFNASSYAGRREYTASRGIATHSRETETQNEVAIASGYDQFARDCNREDECRSPFQAVQNHVTHDFIDAALGGMKIGVLLDIACGKGGAMAKYLPFMKSEGTVHLADISPESIQEVKYRIKGRGLGQFVSKKIRWEPLVASVFSESYWKNFPDDYADVIICNFAFHYAFENVDGARRVLSQISRVLKRGGVFLGITVDADMMCKAASSQSGLFKITGFPAPPLRPGDHYTFELPGHVPPVLEYLIPMASLRQFGEEEGIAPYESHPIFWSNLAHHVDFANFQGYSDADLKNAKSLCELYYTFMFEKPVQETAAPVAVYTGSFDPAHLNHIGLCKHLIDKEGFEKVLIVPNGASPLKPWAASYEDRKRMVELGIKDAALHDKCCVGECPGDDWKGRLDICRRLGRNYPDRIVFLVLGQDSYEKSVRRASNSRGRGIFSMARSGFKIVVLKRTSNKCNTDVFIPAPLARVVRVLSSYQDPIALSSTLARKYIASSSDLTEIVSQSVAEYLKEHQLYQSRVSNDRIIVVMGGSRPTFDKIAHWLQRYALPMDASTTNMSEHIGADDRYIIRGLGTKDIAEFEKTVAQIDTIILIAGGIGLESVGDHQIDEEVLESFASIGGSLIKCSESSLKKDIAPFLERVPGLQTSAPCREIRHTLPGKSISDTVLKSIARQVDA